MRKKVLIVLINDVPFNDGEPFFENEIKFLSNKFDEIVVFSVNGHKNEKATRAVNDNVRVFPLSCNHNRLKYLLKGLLSSNKIFNIHKIHSKRKITALYLKGKNFDIAKKSVLALKSNLSLDADYYIYSYWLTLGISLCLIRNYLFSVTNKRPRTISRCHGYDVYSELQPFGYHPFQKEVVEELDGIFPCSEFGTNYLKTKYPNISNRINVARLSSNDHGMKEFNFNDSTKRFVTVAGFRPIKRLDLFAKAFSILAKERNDIFWDAFGSGEEYDTVLKIAKENGVLDRIYFHGNVPNDDIYDYYKKNNVFFYINTSFSEGISVSIMEAISFGIPVLATDVGGTSEIVDESNGFLVARDISPEELAVSLMQTLNLDKNRYNQLRINSRTKWEKLYNSKYNLELWYKNLVAKE